MFQAERTYPCAIADQSDEGHEAALEWLLGHLAPDQRLTVWVSQKGVLTANEFVRSCVRQSGVRIPVSVSR